jgi:hypothetical protein
MRTASARRPLGLLGAGLTAGVLLSGCGSAETPTVPAAATHAASAAPAAETSGADLSAGLLPADAFGDGATVLPVPTGQLGALSAMAGSLPAVDVQQGQECVTAVQSLLPQLAAVEDAAVQVARTDGPLAVEALAVVPEGTDAPALLSGLLPACSVVDASAAGYGSGHVTVTDLAGTPGLPAGAAAVAITVSVTGADGRAFDGTALAGVVQDGDRVLALAQVDPHGGPVDPADFAALLTKAYEAQADALD